MIRFTCSACSKNISVPPEHAGRQVRCPGCHHVQLAPESPEPILTPDPSSPEPAPTNDERVEIEPAEPPPMPAPPSLSTEPLEQDPPDTRFFAPLIYPFTGSGKFNMLMLLIPLALFAVMQYLMFLFMSASFVPFIGKLIVLAADLAYAIYVGAYMLSILASSANGELEPPDWPAFSGWWSDVIRPVLSCWIVAIIPFIPAIIYLVWAVLRAIHGTRGASISPEAFRALSIIFWLSIAAGWALSPMVLLAAVLSEPFEALRPSLIFGSIARTFPAFSDERCGF